MHAVEEKQVHFKITELTNLKVLSEVVDRSCIGHSSPAQGYGGSITNRSTLVEPTYS